MPEQEIPQYCPANRKEWRQWLRSNHNKQAAVWLIMYKRDSGRPTISWTEAVEEALCYGWIDGRRKPVDDESFVQYFCRRKPKGTWSKINKEKVQELIDKKLMTKAGLAAIETAKQNGAWNSLDEAEELIVPEDLEKAFKLHPGSKQYFTGLSKSVRKFMLTWIAMAKRAETRQKRINELTTLGAQGKKPKLFG